MAATSSIPSHNSQSPLAKIATPPREKEGGLGGVGNIAKERETKTLLSPSTKTAKAATFSPSLGGGGLARTS